MNKISFNDLNLWLKIPIIFIWFLLAFWGFAFAYGFMSGVFNV